MLKDLANKTSGELRVFSWCVRSDMSDRLEYDSIRDCVPGDEDVKEWGGVNSAHIGGFTLSWVCWGGTNITERGVTSSWVCLL